MFQFTEGLLSSFSRHIFAPIYCGRKGLGCGGRARNLCHLKRHGPWLDAWLIG